MISLIHPSRQRPDKSWTTTRHWLESAGSNDVELIVSLDEDDPTLSRYEELYYDGSGAKIIIANNISAISAINRAARYAKGNILIVLSDDFDCPDNWAIKIQKAASGLHDFVIKIDDGIQDWIVTMPIIDRAYYNRFGYIYFPGYKHMFCDTEFTHIADGLGRIHRRHDLFFPHNHYCIGKGIKDEINIRADKTWNQGKNLYLNRAKEGFGLGIDPFRISSINHKKWLRQNLI